MIYYIPIEPLKERYTEQWLRWFPTKFKAVGYEVITIHGNPLSPDIKVGTFLDLNSTMHYKASQLQEIARLFYNGVIHDGDIFFIADLEFPGIEMVKYMAHLQNINIKIYGFMHAASYTREDFMEPARPYGKYFEQGWLRICDKVFVGSYYHQKKLLDIFGTDIPLIIETGNPWDTNEALGMIKGVEKENIIIFPNRWDFDKRPNDFLTFVELMQGTKVKIIVTTGAKALRSNQKWLLELARRYQEQGKISIYENLTKTEYYQWLMRAKIMVSTSIEENFGYCVIEAMTFGCMPLLPNNYSYPELVNNNPEFLYEDLGELKEKAIKLLDKTIPRSCLFSLAQRYDGSIGRMIAEMQ